MRQTRFRSFLFCEGSNRATECTPFLPVLHKRSRRLDEAGAVAMTVPYYARPLGASTLWIWTNSHTEHVPSAPWKVASLSRRRYYDDCQKAPVSRVGIKFPSPLHTTPSFLWSRMGGHAPRRTDAVLACETARTCKTEVTCVEARYWQEIRIAHLTGPERFPLKPTMTGRQRGLTAHRALHAWDASHVQSWFDI